MKNLTLVAWTGDFSLFAEICRFSNVGPESDSFASWASSRQLIVPVGRDKSGIATIGGVDQFATMDVPAGHAAIRAHAKSKTSAGLV